MAKYCVFFAILVTISACDAQICNVTIRTDLPDNEPVYLKVINGQARLWIPDGPNLLWSTNQADTVLLCSGNSNMLLPTNSVSSRITCVSEKTFSVQENMFTSLQLKCRARITGNAFNSKRSCGEQSELLYLGFAPQTAGFIPYIESCMNMTRASVLWTRHILPGAAIRGAMSEPSSSSQKFKDPEMPKTVNASKSYLQLTQLARLTQLLGSEQQALRYVFPGTTKYMARGHMTPNADGIFRSWKSATYFYLNAVPKWQVINNGNWAHVERVTRSVAAIVKENFVVIQGTYEILTLPHEDGRRIPITLETNGIEVPRWVWKIIKLPRNELGIAFVTFNNPYEAPQDFICRDICSLTGWSEAVYSDVSKGFTYCCDPNELIHKVKTAPLEGQVKDVLIKPLKGPEQQKKSNQSESVLLEILKLIVKLVFGLFEIIVNIVKMITQFFYKNNKP